ncbi:hypothetical protein BDP27DRAFT_1361354 [Rhodocollybia butyracea]|uniref:Uncharacterized protein n=1 Tax=Rhodocollybia butyracea TaxID=206335 RepID=A0A9P5PZW9_9AGAR|nr:hypothetical protein BDP27DRAFT_1361354 [Rhodocollybia butyracea]
MSPSNADLLSTPTVVAVSSDNAATEDANLSHVGVALKAFTDRTPVEDSVSSGAGSAIDKQLSPPAGTRGFMNQVYQVPIAGRRDQNLNMQWIVDVYAYRHAKSNNVTLIVLHSGLVQGIPDTSGTTTFELWTTPETAYKFQYPVSYNSKLGNNKYSYSIDYTQDINMTGPDGKNSIVFKAVYKETFDEPYMEGSVGHHLKIVQPGDGQIHGMSVFNASFEVGTSMVIGELFPRNSHAHYTLEMEQLVDPSPHDSNWNP